MRLFPVLPILLLAAPAAASQLTTGTGPEIPWLRLAVALAVSTAVAAWAILALRRRPGTEGQLAACFRKICTAPQRRIVILETRRASQHGDLCLLEVEEIRYLIALTANGATLLERRELPDGSAAGTPE